MKAVQKLINAEKEMKLGNHEVLRLNDEEGNLLARGFKYYATIICLVNEIDRIFIIDTSYGSASTTRACNAYRKYLQELGYKEYKGEG